MFKTCGIFENIYIFYIFFFLIKNEKKVFYNFERQFVMLTTSKSAFLPVAGLYRNQSHNIVESFPVEHPISIVCCTADSTAIKQV